MVDRWTTTDSDDIYGVSRWGKPYFQIGKAGELIATPKGKSGGEVNMRALVENLRDRGISPPVLLRFSDILGERIGEIYGAFRSAMEEYQYKGDYKAVVPIKVNQQKHVVDELISYGRPYNIGLEAGSKPELLAAIAMIDDPEAVIICNGYKDFEYLETALLSTKVGLNTMIICDRFQEILDLITLKKQRGLVGPIGMRIKLSSKGAGRWAESGGESSKFGLTTVEAVRAVDLLKAEGMLDQVKALHFHIGSQITAIRAVTGAIREASRVYVDLAKMGCAMGYLDVGGGLAVDYDGSATNFPSSMNYGIREYAADIVSELRDACDKAGVAHPTIISESGRALVAHHSVLVFDVLGVNEVMRDTPVPPPNGMEEHEAIRDMRKAFEKISIRNLQEAYNDLLEAKEQINSFFNLGLIDLRQRARGEEIFWAGARKIDQLTGSLDYVPEDLEGLRRRMFDTYYCNFSVFQSVPDHWAVGALFPVVPLQRLTEEPKRRALLADLTCDSDGKISKFIDLHDVKTTLPLHELSDDERYYIGVFLVGAYQETLGDLHNLFGDTNAVHISMDDAGNYRIHHHVMGDSVSDVLGYMEYDTKDLIWRVRMATEAALKAGRMTFDEVRLLMKRYETGLAGYTYLEDADEMI